VNKWDELLEKLISTDAYYKVLKELGHDDE